MKALSFIFLLCYLIQSLPDDGNVSSSDFLGIALKTTTFEDADSILIKKSFKEPKLYFKSILRSDGTSATLNLPSYFGRIGKSEIKVTLKGYSTVGQIDISNIRSEGDVRYKNVLLGQTKVSDIRSVKEWNWSRSEDIDGNVSLTARYKDIRIGVDPNSPKELSDRIITLFILSGDK